MPRRKPRPLPEGLVPHARYGAVPTVSGIEVQETELREGFWRLAGERIFPESVLIANTERQNYSMYPRRWYVDVLRTCRTCGRPFIFFAKEQRHWFETLRFFVDADCVHCPECRRASNAVRRRLRRYSDLAAMKKPTRAQWMTLVDDAVFLLEKGVLRKLDAVGAVKNKAAAVIPQYPGVQTLATAIASARRAGTSAGPLAVDRS